MIQLQALYWGLQKRDLRQRIIKGRPTDTKVYIEIYVSKQDSFAALVAITTGKSSCDWLGSDTHSPWHYFGVTVN